MNRNFGQIVKTCRHRLDLTQNELAEQASCATITIRRIEANTLRPSTQLAEKLAEVLAIPLDEKEIFVSLARTNPNSDTFAEEAMDGNQSDQATQRINYLLFFSPIFLILFVLAINPNYLRTLVTRQPPFVVATILPWGWLVVLLIAGLLWLSWRLLWHGEQDGLQDRSGPVLLFLTFPTLFIILVAPAVLMVFRSGVLD